MFSFLLKTWDFGGSEAQNPSSDFTRGQKQRFTNNKRIWIMLSAPGISNREKMLSKPMV